MAFFKASKKIELSPFKKQLIRVGLIGVILIGLCLGGIIYMNKQVSVQVKNIENYKTDIATRNLILQSVQGLEGDYQKIKDDIVLLESLLPTSEKLIDLSAALKTVANNYDIDQGLSFTIENPASGGEPKSYGFTLVVSGTTSNLLKYFADVEKLHYFMRFDQIDMGIVSGDTVAQGVYRLNILGRVYIR